MIDRASKKTIASYAVLLVLLLVIIPINVALRPISGEISYQSFHVAQGEALENVSKRLADEGFIRSSVAFKLLGILSGSSKKIQPGKYELSPHLSGASILKELTNSKNRTVTVTIPEGLTVYDVDRLLGEIGVISPGSLIDMAKTEALEGRLFPDTYNFLIGSGEKEIARIFIENFNRKAGPILNQDPENFDVNLTLASIIEKEVPDPEEMKVVSGLLKKRIKAGMPLQVDATICYLKRMRAERGDSSCYPLTSLDTKIDSDYNTYLYKGWPPGPIASPGLSAVLAALEPKTSPYWFYLSDPVTKRTIFSKTLEEHNRNILNYLKS